MYLFIHWQVSALKKKVIFKEILDVVVVQLISCVWLFATPWTIPRQASLSFTISQGLLKLMSVESVMPSNHVILLLPPSSLALSRSQYQGLWVSSWYQVSKVLELQLQHQVLPMNIQGWFPLGWTGLISLLSKGLSRVFSSTAVWKHQFFSVLYGPTHIHTYYLKNYSFDYMDLYWKSDVSAF